MQGFTGCVLRCTGLILLCAEHPGTACCLEQLLTAGHSWDYGHFIQSLMEEQRDGGGAVRIAFYLVLGIKKHLPLHFQLCSSTACLLKCRTWELQGEGGKGRTVSVIYVLD